jgi:uncharacterized phage infection (PIP) family protein YhgE
MGNISSELYPMNETNEKVHHIMNNLKQGRRLLENRSSIADTEMNSLEGFTGSVNTVQNQLNDYKNELEIEHQRLKTLVSEYITLVNDSETTTADIETKKNEVDTQQEKVKELTANINDYYQNTVIPDINEAKQEMNEYNTYITRGSEELKNTRGNTKIPPIYYALNENVHTLERMRYYSYVLYLLVFLGFIITLYIMGIGFETVIKQLKKVPQIINNGFNRLL